MLSIRFLLVVLLSTPVSVSFSQNTFSIVGNNLEKGITSTIPYRDIDFLDDGIEVVYKFKGINTYPDPIFKSASFVKIDGFGFNDNEGEPSIPIRWDSFLIPKEAKVTITLEDSTIINIPMEISPSRKQLSDYTYEGYDSTNVSSIKPYTGYYPQKHITDTNLSDFSDYKICRLCICPIKYNYSDKSILFASLLKYHISWDGYDKKTSLIRGKAYLDSDVLLNNTCLNYCLDNVSEQSVNPFVSNYLIITHPLFYDAAVKFSQWKKLLGYNTFITCKSDWTSNEIKDSVVHYYNSLGSLEYLLIFGDNEYVPAKQYLNQDGNEHIDNYYYSDYWYGCISGNESGIAEIKRGRLPASTLEQAYTIIDKIICYEYNPPEDENFYQKGMNCAYFQDECKYGHNEYGGYDGVENRRFVKTSEEIRDYLIAKEKDVIRVYDANALANPLRYNNDLYSFGDSIPAELRRSNFLWNGNYIDIINNINSGTFYVLHRDHGNVNCWGDPRIYNFHVSSLTNGNKLPVIFSINCLTGKFDYSSDCFAEAFLKNPNGGCVAIYAATNETYSGYNDALADGMFNSIWPNPGLVPLFPYQQNNYTYQSAPLYKLGYILDNGFLKMEETYNTSIITKRWYHCFGDPSMQIYTDKPSVFSSPSVSRTTSKIEVQTGEGNAYISFYDCLRDLVQCFYASSIEFNSPLFDLNNTIVCISSHI